MNILQAVTILTQGGVLVYPTETFYAIGCDARNASAVSALVSIKGRPAGKPFPLIIGSAEQLPLVAAIDQGAPTWMTETIQKLADYFWPGPLTILAPPVQNLCPELIGPDGMAAVRVSGHAMARELSVQAGAPLVATSANLSGMPPASAPERLAPEILAHASGVFHGGAKPLGQIPSTIVRPTPPENNTFTISILRTGMITEAMLINHGFTVR